MTPADPIEIATRTYYWKPMAAFFRSLEIELYVRSRIEFDAPLLDLGCGDGGVAQMLREAGALSGNPCGIDIEHGELKKARDRKLHQGIFQADANRLPFEAESFASIVCNGVLCSIPEGVEQALSEVHRVLRSGGLVVATVPTDRFIDVLLLPRLLGRLSPSLRSRYVGKLNARLPHFNTYAAGEWTSKFESNGLRVVRKDEFFPPRAGSLWSILSMQVFRVFGLLKLVGSRSVAQGHGKLLERCFRRRATERPAEGAPAGYVFIVARKA